MLASPHEHFILHVKKCCSTASAFGFLLDDEDHRHKADSYRI
jgi:hypothetical protein